LRKPIPRKKRRPKGVKQPLSLPKMPSRQGRVYELSEAERVCQGCGKARVVIGHRPRRRR
jgi:hypothetical protein